MIAIVMKSWIAAFVLVAAVAGPLSAEEKAITGSVHLYTSVKKSPAPLSGYEVTLIDQKTKKESSPSVTDAYGRYAFFGIESNKYVLKVSKPGPYWRQSLWQQEVKAPGAVKPIVLPNPADIVPHASYVPRKGQKDLYDFSLWLDVPNEQRAGITRVTYVFNHPTFKNKEHSSVKAEDGFRVGYMGWGCLDTVTIKIERNVGDSLITFKMCEAFTAKTKK